MDNCIFCKIGKHEIPKEFTYEDDEIMVFPDINPVKPIHLLVVPKKHVADFLDLKDDHLTTRIRGIIQKIVIEKELKEKGYRLVVHGGGAQAIYHLHIHVLGPMGKAAKL